jgi:nucleotidyltransferase substrate binding protein (TIGR01987 family)
MAVDLTSFSKALDSLERALDRARQAPIDEELRDAAIQRFEYTYELAWKSLKRVLEEEAPSQEVIESLSFKDLIRLGAERGLIRNPRDWFGYREARNISSHTYDQAKAASVFRTVTQFAPVARELLTALGRRSK